MICKSTLLKKIPIRHSPMRACSLQSSRAKCPGADGPARVLPLPGKGLINGCIDLVHDPHEEPPVDALKEMRLHLKPQLPRETGQTPSLGLRRPHSSLFLLQETPTSLFQLFPLPGAPSPA